ncbi:hypothetical protein [Novosphingobium sp.]|uniref:hypothetical protein n=1 Tax=Novosphingobium sp. TaxID=1874826 RepID=UPI0035B3F7EC
MSDRAVQTFNGRAQSMIAAANSDEPDTKLYVAQLKSTCGGLVGDLMSAHMPNALGIQLQSFCMGVGDLERAVKANKSGRNAYCGDFDQGIKAARKMTRGPENEAVYDSAQQLAGAAEKIKATRFSSTRRVGYDLSLEYKGQTMSCN